MTQPSPSPAGATGSAPPEQLPAAEVLRWQAVSCRPGSPLYADLLARLADDADAGGPTATVLAGHDTDPPGSALGLRLMAAVHRAVLERRAPALALCYPSVGGHGRAHDAWPALRALLAEQAEEVRADLLRPCQTNEPGRVAGLLTGLLHAVRATGLDRVRLLEIGASAGLNLRADHYRVGPLGPADSPCVIRDPWPARAPEPVGYVVVERRGCDPAPVDATTPEGRLALTSSVWADQTERLARLRGALAVAAAVPAVVDRAHAGPWLQEQLARERPGVLTVVWHSVVLQYVDPVERASIAGTIAAAPGVVVRVSQEPEQGVGFPVEVTVRGQTTRVAVAGPHGPPVVLV